MGNQSTIALILAAGEARRMNGKLKQLLPMGNTTIIGRTLTQLKSCQQRTIMVTHKSEIAACHHRVHDPVKRDTVCDSLLSAAHLWDDRTIVLLGDVVYSNDTFNRIMDCRDRIRVFGNTAEIFAIVFSSKEHAKVRAALRKASKHRLGKLRYFYRQYCGLPVDMREMRGHPPEARVFYRIKDWTRDVDTPYHYKRLLAELVNTGRINDTE